MTAKKSPVNKKMGPREMWVRRIISLVALAAILTLIVFLIVKLVGAFTGKSEPEFIQSAQSSQSGQSGQSGAQSASENATAGEEIPTGPIPVCAADDLDFILTPVTANRAVGVGVDGAVTVINRGDVDCSINTGQIDVRLVTGDDTVWSPTACNDKWEKPLLFTPGLRWRADMKWNGALYEGCTAVAGGQSGGPLQAPAGTYRLVVEFDGVLLSNHATFVID